MKYNKFSVIILLAFLSILFSGSLLYSKSSVTWYDFNEGYKLAKSQKKFIMLDMYADYCGWCKVMDKETFSNREVVKILNKYFIAVRVDMNSRKRINYKGYSISAPEFSRVFGVQGLPTVVFLDMNGEFIDKVPGFTGPSIFIKILEYIKGECYKKKISFKDFAEGRVKCN